MDKLSHLYALCENIESVVDLYIRTKHNSGSFHLAKERLLVLTNTPNPDPPTEDNLAWMRGKPEDWYTLDGVRSVQNSRFGLWGSDFELKVHTLPVKGIKNILPILLRLFDHLFENITRAAADDDLVRIVLQSRQLSRPIALRTTRKGDLNTEMFFESCATVLQSNEDFSLEDPIYINVTRVKALPEAGGGGRGRHEALFSKHLQKKRTVISIHRDRDGLCLARSIVVGRAICDGIADQEDQRVWKSLTRTDRRKTLQYKEAMALHDTVHLRPGPVSLDQVQRFQTLLTNYQIIVYGSDNLTDVLFSGPDRPNKIHLLLHDNHYSTIRRLVPFVNKRVQCQYCKGLYAKTTNRHHRCPNLCYVCLRPSTQCSRDEELYCPLCNRTFGNQVCFTSHQNILFTDIPPICVTHYICRECGKSINRLAKRVHDRHVCHEHHCRNCKMLVVPDHQCYIKQYTKPPKETSNFIYADFECDLSTAVHIPVCAVAMYDSGECIEFYGANTQNEFCAWLFHKKHRNYIALFHNMSGYDGNFLLQFLQHNKIQPCVTMKGLKIIQIDVKPLNICIRDTLCHLPFKLSALPKAFNIPDLTKGMFPFLFTRPENYSYVGPVPGIEHFFTHSLSTSERLTLNQWLASRQQDPEPWNFRNEMLSYCRSDVNILRLACQKYSNNMRVITGFCPLTESTTLAGFVNLIYRATFMPENSIALLPEKSFGAGRNTSIEAKEWLFYMNHMHPEMQIRHAHNHIDGEKRIGRYRVDGYDENSRTVFEYQGCYYHGHISCFAPDARNLSGAFMRDLYFDCLARKKHLEEMGFNYVEIWGCEWKKFKLEDAECKEILQALPYCKPLDPRAALRGGRSEAFQLLCIPTPNQHIAYKDCISMYPSILRDRCFPVGHPEIITRNFLPLDKYFGLASVRVLPPRHLHIPLLPVLLNHKMYFTLCRTCAETNQKSPCSHMDNERALHVTLPTIELNAAIQRGYRIQEIYEVWHYERSSSVLFRAYIDCFRAIKIKSSGYATDCDTVEKKQAYVASLAEKGVHLTVDEIEDNPVMRLLTKLLMNCLYGRFALRQNLPKFEYITDVNRFQLLMFSNKFVVDYLNILDEKTVQIQYHHEDEFESSDLNSNVVIAGFCTAYGRLILYESMEHLEPERVLYCDTDSVFFLESNLYITTIPTGVDFGDFKDELDGDQITAFFCAGSKSYAYRTAHGQEVFKAKGLTINSSNKDIFSLTAIEEMIRDPQVVRIVCNPLKIFRTKGTWQVYSKAQDKIFRFVYDKRVLHSDFTTLPYGFVKS